MTAVAEIPVHVAKKIIKACLLVPVLRLSLCPWHLGMSWTIHCVCGNHTRTFGDILRKPIKTVSCISSFLVGSVFAKNMLIDGPGTPFCFQPVYRVQPPLVGRGTPQSHLVFSAERSWKQPQAVWKLCFSSPFMF